MSNYGFLAQMLQGPQIDVNLFPKAMSAGAQASRYDPGVWGAIGQGIQQGVSNFMDTYTGFQQIDLNAEKLEQAKVQTQLAKEVASPANVARREELAQMGMESAERRQTVEEMQFGAVQEDWPNIRQTQKSQYATAAQAAQEQQVVTAQYGYLMDGLRNDATTTDDLTDMFLDGSKYSDVYLKEPQLQLKGLEKLMRRAEQEQNADLFAQAATKYDDVSSEIYYKEDRRKNLNQWTKDVDEAANGDIMRSMIQPGRYGYPTAEQAIPNLEILQEGSYETVGTGIMPKLRKDGSIVKIPGFNPGTKADRTFHMFLRDPMDRYKLHPVGTALEDQLKPLRTGQTSYSKMTGSALAQRKMMNRSFQQNAAAAGRPQKSFYPIGPTAPTINRSENVKKAAAIPGAAGVMQTAVEQFKSVDKATIEFLSPQFNNIDKIITDYQNDTSFRILDYTPWGRLHAANADADIIVNTIADREYELSAELKGEKGAQILEAWNAEMDQKRKFATAPRNAQERMWYKDPNALYPKFNNVRDYWRYRRSEQIRADIDNIMRRRLREAQQERSNLLKAVPASIR